MCENYDMLMVVSTHPCCAGEYAERDEVDDADQLA